MLAKHKIVSEILDIGIVAIVRVENFETAELVVASCLQGGVNAIEVTFTVDKANIIIDKISNAYPDCLLGAGTVLDSETARIAILAGAKYIVSPAFDEATAKLCNRYAIPYMPGCYTPTEVLKALDFGVDIIKLYPSAFSQPAIIRTFSAPLPQANFMPTGGVNIDNAKDWIKAGAVALGIGGDLISVLKSYSGNLTPADKALISKNIQEKASAYKEVVRQARTK